GLRSPAPSYRLHLALDHGLTGSVDDVDDGVDAAVTEVELGAADRRHFSQVDHHAVHVFDDLGKPLAVEVAEAHNAGVQARVDLDRNATSRRRVDSRESERRMNGLARLPAKF